MGLKTADDIAIDGFDDPDAATDGRDSLLPVSTQTETTSPAPPASNQAVPYLDGLRGVAALFVYFHHHVTEYYGDQAEILHGYGYKDSHHFAALPFARLFFTGGTPAVMIFFVLSGYVLSRSSLRMLRDGHSPSKHLLNAAIRRPIRLFAPPFLLSWPLVFILHSPLKPINNPLPIQPNLFAEIGHYLMELLRTYNPFIQHGPWIQWFTYDPPVWTMAYEFNGSLLVYGTVALFGRYLSARGRGIGFGVAAIVAFYNCHFSMPCFMMGSLLAQNDVSAFDHSLLQRIPEQTRNIFFSAGFVFSWYLLSQVNPIDPAVPSTLDNLLRLLPLPFPFDFNPWLFSNMLGGIILVYTLLRLPWAQRVFSHKYIRFLGRVSFCLYLTHVPLMWIVSAPLRRLLGETAKPDTKKLLVDGLLYIPDVGVQGLTTRYLVMQAAILPLNLLLADFVTTAVDERSVQASKIFAKNVMQRFGL
ncbi:hypothetical protein ANO11243_042530 [Dothideomycetidae sp. 11243]|nr:hypothetical protein ANO11243_042530 [fungal sp. No.11243]